MNIVIFVDLVARHRADIINKEVALNSLRDREIELKKTFDLVTQENQELGGKLKSAQEELAQASTASVDEVERLRNKLKQEQLLKMQAVNKLAEIMNRKDMNPVGRKPKNAGGSADLRRKEKECRKLQQELTQEREKYNQVVAKSQKETQVDFIEFSILGTFLLNCLNYLGFAIIALRRKSASNQAADGGGQQGL